MLLLILPLKAVSGYRIVSPDQLTPLIFEFLEDNKDLPEQELSSSLKKYLVDQGFTFAQVVVSDAAGVPTVEVKSGFMGKAKVRGNEHFGEESILENLNWKTGEPFNYTKFYNHTARFNKYRFVNVDSKLKPVRGHRGEIQVDADFDVKD